MVNWAIFLNGCLQWSWSFSVVLGLRKSDFKPLGDHRIQFSATGDEEFNDVDWTLRVEGQWHRMHRAVLLTVSVPLLFAFGLEFWSIDFRKRASCASKLELLGLVCFGIGHHWTIVLLRVCTSHGIELSYIIV